MARNCENCKHEDLDDYDDPCEDCDGQDEWEPKETVTNTNLGESSMKEQKIYDVTVVERIEDLHDASGVIQGIKRKVLIDQKFSAVTEESAKQKALDKSGNADYDNLEITCRPFQGS